MVVDYTGTRSCTRALRGSDLFDSGARTAQIVLAIEHWKQAQEIRDAPLISFTPGAALQFNTP